MKQQTQLKQTWALLLSLVLLAAAGLYAANGASGQGTGAALKATGAAHASSAPIPAGTYQLDPAHSSINFSVRHLTINLVRGRFTDFSGVIRYDDKDIAHSSVEFTAKAASINTDVAKRDEHLKSADFFDVAKYPEITFKSTGVERRGNDAFLAHGDFTLHGVTKQISLPFKLTGPVRDPWGGTRFGVEASTTLKRQDFGMNYAQMVEGGPVIANDVEINLQLEAVKQEPKKQTSQE
jgi:polyisoprenoid-binding protein YceI